MPTWVELNTSGTALGRICSSVSNCATVSPQIVEVRWTSQPHQSEVKQKAPAVSRPGNPPDVDDGEATAGMAIRSTRHKSGTEKSEAVFRKATKFIERQRLPSEYRVITDSFLRAVARCTDRTSTVRRRRRSPTVFRGEVRGWHRYMSSGHAGQGTCPRPSRARRRHRTSRWRTRTARAASTSGCATDGTPGTSGPSATPTTNRQAQAAHGVRQDPYRSARQDEGCPRAPRQRRGGQGLQADAGRLAGALAGHHLGGV